MKNVLDQLLYFFLGIDKKRRSRKKNAKFRAISETHAIIPGEGYDLFPHIDFPFER